MIVYPKVQILLSSYNGEKYIREQLDSFLRLDDYENINVLIRDDGSIDSTAAILKEYEVKYGFKVIYGENIGINSSYNLLFKYADLTCNFFALCDQDDVWLPHKIARGVELLSQQCDIDKPLLYGSRVEIVDEKLKHLGYSPIYKKGTSFYNALTQNILPGHTMILNRALFQIVLNVPDRNEIVTDWLIYLAGTGIGHAVYDETIGVLHRQHKNNAIGYEQNFIKSTIKRLRRLKNGKVNQNSIQLKVFYESYMDFLPKDYRQEIDNYLRSLDNIYTRIIYVMTCKAYRQSIFENLLFKSLYILGKYKLR